MRVRLFALYFRTEQGHNLLHSRKCFSDDTGNKKAEEKAKEDFKPLLVYREKTLEGKITQVQIPTRLTKSPVSFTVDEQEERPWMEKLLQRGADACRSVVVC